MTPELLRRLARYNAWANGRLYAACGQLTAEELARPCPSFFGSILATLNHLLVVDRVWMGRFKGVKDTGITSLDQMLHADFAELAAARTAYDVHLVEWFDALESDLGRPFQYRIMAGNKVESPLGLTMLHMFNHQTHHRGQVHDMLSATAVAPPPLDLIYFLREG
ncbi:MAG: DinB family protein [Magnetospirillum sp.]|nr:DinB family protein [Magnetospirillum sp.]